VDPVEVCGYVVEFVGIQVAVDVRRDCGRGVRHGFLDIAKVSAGGAGQAGVGVA
jgi:hypothetical protein